MTNTIIENFDDYAFEDLKSLKADLTAFLKNKRVEMKESDKEAKKAIQEELTKKAKEIVFKGAEITCKVGGKNVTGTVTKVTDRTFTFEYEDETTGETKSQWRHYYWVVLPENQ